MIGGRVARGLLILAFVALIGWPCLATAFEAITGEAAEPPARGLMTPVSDDATVRPARLAWKTTQLVLATEAMALPIGVALAWLLFRTDLWGRRSLLGLMALMALVPMPLLATAWLGGFGNLGRSQAIGSGPILVGLPGAAFVHAIAALPWIVFIVGIGLLTVEPELEDAARLELPSWRVVLHITLRRGMGAIAAAALAVAVLTAGDMTVTDLLSVRTYAEEAYLQFQLGQGPAAASGVAIPPLVILGSLLWIGGRRLMRADPARVVSPSLQARPWRLGRWRIGLGLMASLLIGSLVALPLYSLVWRAGRVGGKASLGLLPHWSLGGLAGSLGEGFKAILGPFASEPLRSPLLSSLVWAILAATLTVLIAWPLAWLARGSRNWRWFAVVAASIAWAAPGPVVGMALVMAYRSVGPIYNTGAIVVLAEVARVWPYAFLILWVTLRSIPKEYEEAAILDGCGPWQVVRKVAIPLSFKAIVVAWVASFLLAVGELPASGLVAPPGLNTLPILIWGSLHIGVESRLAAVGLLNLAFFSLAFGVAAWGIGRLNAGTKGS